MAEDIGNADQVRFRACDLCEAICGLEFRMRDGRPQAIRGDVLDPFSRGFICPKGNAILDLEADPDRLRRPLRRRGGHFEEIGWDEAISWAGERIAEIQSAHGDDAVAVYLGNPNVHHFGSFAYLPPLLKLLRSRNTYSASSVDQWPHQMVNRLMFGHQFLLPIPDLDRTRFLLMLGANPVASNGSLMTAPGMPKRLKALTERGTLVVVDPRRTETAALASRHLPIRPGGDVFFLIGLLRRLTALGPPRLDRYQGRLVGFEQAIDALARFAIADLTAACGLSEADIASVAEGLWQADGGVVYGRMGVSTQAHGSLCQWLIQLANLYTGNLDREGGALVNQPIVPITGPGTSAGGIGRWHSRVRGLPEFAGELPVAALAEEMLTPGPGQVRALISIAGNPVLSTPDGSRLEQALTGLDLRIAIDIYLNETSRHADLVLPPASSLSQSHYDSIFNAFAVRRIARINRPLYPRGADERGDWEILTALASAIARHKGVPFNPLPEPDRLIAHAIALSGLDPSELAAAEHGLDLGPLRPSLLDRLETPSAAIECAPAILLAELARLSPEQTYTETGQPGSLRLFGRRDIRSNNSWMHNAPRLIKGRSRHQLLVHPNDLAARGLADGASARLRSRRGAIPVDLSASTDVRPGAVCLPHGFGHGHGRNPQRLASGVVGASYNDLTDPEQIDPVSGNAALNGIEVWLDAGAA